jgi:hypothetical protein
MKKCLDAAQMAQISSHYLVEGRKQESWRIEDVVIEGRHLQAKVVMNSIYTSATDTNGFHLTIFSTLEFLSQIMIIYVHVWAGEEKKTREGWMVESHIRCVRAIRNPNDLRVAMQVKSIRRRGQNVHCVADFKVTDDQGGLFEVQLKGFH